VIERGHTRHANRTHEGPFWARSNSLHDPLLTVEVMRIQNGEITDNCDVQSSIPNTTERQLDFLAEQ
jgi:hypothetical protein